MKTKEQLVEELKKFAKMYPSMHLGILFDTNYLDHEATSAATMATLTQTYVNMSKGLAKKQKQYEAISEAVKAYLILGLPLNDLIDKCKIYHNKTKEVIE